MIKCVVWDIDNTLLAGTYLESGAHPPGPDPELLGVLRELDHRGIVNALASKNPPDAAAYVATVTGVPFAAAECGWGRKSDAVRRIIDDLGLGADTVAFVDDDMLERAEVAAALPEVLVLLPEDAVDAPSWPEFSPAVITAEGRRRGEMYAQRRRRQEEARAFGGSRDDFLRHTGTRVLIAPAGLDDMPRLHELSVRTHQFNTAGTPVGEDELAGLHGSAGHRLVAVRLRDRFGDDGIVGGALIDRGEANDSGVPPDAGTARSWTVSLLMMSCRALGRGVLDALLAALCQQAVADGAAELRIPCLVTDRNVPLRLALTAAGFRAGAQPQPGEPARFARPLTGSLPGLPDWATVAGLAVTPGDQPAGGSVHWEGSGPWDGSGAAGESGVLAELRAILDRVTGRDQTAVIAPETALFGDGVGLDSLTGTLLLVEVQHRFGVDVAAEDLNLDCLATLATLAAFIGERLPARDAR